MSFPTRIFDGPAAWEDLRAGFRWPAPAQFNIAEIACARWARADPDRLALIHVAAEGPVREISYGHLDRWAARFANVLSAAGIGRGDRVAVLLPQCPEALVVHFACYRLGAVVVPLFTLFGEDGLSYRLTDSGAVGVVTDAANLPKVDAIRGGLPDLESVYAIDGGAISFWDSIEAAAETAPMAATSPDDPALLSYTSGTTGPPKGALHGHRVLLGHLPGVETHHDFLPQAGDRMWTPADWAWVGGLINIALPALTYGVPLVAHRMAKFDPGHAWWLMEHLSVRNVFLPPTALKLLRGTPPPHPPRLRTVASGGEALGAETLAWGREVFGREINEFYGQTECNLILGNSAASFPPKPGSMGRAVPGHRVAVIDDAGQELPTGAVGEVAVARDDPGMFLRYWNQPEKTEEKFLGDWMRTGDLASVDEDGHFFFEARTDDVITSSGYRIGPSEIEDCLTGHPDVSLAAAIGVPDPVRTEAVKAFVVLRPGAEGDLSAALIDRVRTRLSPHVAPREVEVVESLPMTATGKIMRRALRARA